MPPELTKAPEILEVDFHDLHKNAQEFGIAAMNTAAGGLAAAVIPSDPVKPPELEVPEATKTVYYVNFTDEAKGHIEEVKKLKAKIQNSQGLIFIGTNQQVQKAINDKKLDQTNLEAVGNYTALVTAAYLRSKAAWLNGVVQFVLTDEITVKSTEFHADILKLALKDFVPISVVPMVEKVITAIAKSIANSSSTSHKKGITYMIMTTHFIWDEMTKTVEPKQRVISFQTNESTYSVTKNKTDYKEATIRMTYAMTQADFNEETFDAIWKRVGGPTIDEAVKRIKDDTLDVEVPE